MDNQDQGRDGQPLADHLLLRPEVDPFPPQRANLLTGMSNLSTTVDGITTDWISYLNKLQVYISR